MKITRAADYAIRLLIHLAWDGGEWTSRELSGELDIPLNHLAKLVQSLARRGYLLTRKGKGGGLKLAMNPKKVSVADIIEAIEGPIVVSECILHKKSCRFSGKCQARKCLSQLRQQMQKTLQATSIYDLVPA